ncbi:hypothetical protein [Aliiroseovarius sp.]|uniref:hypothetical protein n=1 Tax=Aliiroseovarius sp. TaxID=1872442 RepID=UPI0026245A16|nr:hypothetical protein [Aliiroseovarius sp.]
MRDIAEFAQAPWNSARIDGIEATETVPTMLAAEEQALYAWLTGHWMRDLGEVVELGSFVGGSTARLAAGLVAAGRTAHLHAYDRFGCSEGLKETMLYPAGIAPFEGTDILPLAHALLAPWRDQVTLHPGRIEKQSWDGGPIELLVMDASKKIPLMDRMAATFFPSLIPGRSLVIQQDYLHWRTPWIAVQMEAMADWFTPVAFVPNDTVVFLNTRPVDSAALLAGQVAEMTPAARLETLRRARRRGRALGYGHRLAQSIKAMKANPDCEAAFRMRAPG